MTTQPYEISFRDLFYDCESEEHAYEALLQYLAECVRNGDVTAFSVEQQEWREKKEFGVTSSENRRASAVEQPARLIP
jgi:hypothetical protein